MKNLIIILWFALCSSAYAQKALSYEQRMKLAYYLHAKKQRDGKVPGNTATKDCHKAEGPSATVKKITISIRELSVKEVEQTKMFCNSQLAEYKSASKWFAMYLVTFKNGGKVAARYCPITQTFFTKTAYISRVKRKDSFDLSFMGAYNDYWDNLYTQIVPPGGTGSNYVLLPRTKKLIANIGVMIGNKDFGRVVLEVGVGNSAVRL